MLNKELYYCRFDMDQVQEETDPFEKQSNVKEKPGKDVQLSQRFRLSSSRAVFALRMWSPSPDVVGPAQDCADECRQVA